MVVAAGRLQVRYWEDSQGKNRKIVEVVAENVYFGDSKKDTDSSGGYQSRYSNYGASSPGSNTGYRNSAANWRVDDELPFCT